MTRKPLELSPEVAREFVRDMRAYFDTKGIAADRFAARQLHALKEHYDGRLKLHEVKELFHLMREEL
jgi:hypothetical protein